MLKSNPFSPSGHAPERRSPLVRRPASLRRRVARGFTLVELLVVVSIIGLLAAIVTTTVMEAIAVAGRTAIAVEMNQIGMGLEQYKAKYGSYPPSSLAGSDFQEYLQRMFPHYDVDSDLADDMTAAFQEVDAGYDYASNNFYRADRAIIFWLVGFSGDPENPLLDHGKRMLGTKTGTPFFEFDKERMEDGAYAAKGNTRHLERRYYYVDNRRYGHASPVLDEFRPYHKGIGTVVGQFYKPDGYQIVYPGRDGKLGTGGGPKTLEVPYSGDDADNMTSFSGNETMFDFSDK